MLSLSFRSPNVRFFHPELDVLRFFAFFLVFLHHSLPHDPAFYTAMGTGPLLASFLAALGAAGALGVILFFLLSAYLITELLIRERARFGRVNLKDFYIRRILRIWPLYFSFLALAWAIQWLVPGQHIGWRAGLAFALFAGNWWVVFVGFPSSIIFHLWFISLQEQFYLFWPATMRKLSTRGLLIAPAVLLAIANLTRWYLAVHHTWESKMWANTFVQLDGIALGIILAVLLAGRAPRLAPLLRAALLRRRLHLPRSGRKLLSDQVRSPHHLPRSPRLPSGSHRSRRHFSRRSAAIGGSRRQRVVCGPIHLPRTHILRPLRLPHPRAHDQRLHGASHRRKPLPLPAPQCRRLHHRRRPRCHQLPLA